MARKYQTIVCTLLESFDPGDFDCDAVRIRDMMQKLIDDHGEGVFLDYDYDCNEHFGSRGTYTVKVRRLETDEEYDARMKKRRDERKLAKAKAVTDKQKRHEMFLKLKEEFEGDEK